MFSIVVFFLRPYLLFLFSHYTGKSPKWSVYFSHANEPLLLYSYLQENQFKHHRRLLINLNSLLCCDVSLLIIITILWYCCLQVGSVEFENCSLTVSSSLSLSSSPANRLCRWQLLISYMLMDLTSMMFRQCLFLFIAKSVVGSNKVIFCALNQLHKGNVWIISPWKWIMAI